MAIRHILAGALAAGLAIPAGAQFGDLLNKAQQKANQAVDKAVSDAVDPEPAGKPAPGAPSGAPAPAAAAPAPATPPSTAKEVGATPSAPAVYGNRYDFVPGDKVLVYDDFSDTDVGEYPAKWSIKDGGGNAIEVVESGGRRFLKSRYQEREQPEAITWLRYEVKGDMPRNFTIEFDMAAACYLSVLFSGRYGLGGQEVWFRPREEMVKSINTSGRFPPAQGVVHVAIAVSGTQLKAYVGGERVLSDPDGVERPITRLGIHFGQPYIEDEGDHQMITNVRVAEGGKPARQMLAGEGRIVTHGILFDTGSDVIKPESGPTLRTILALLKEDPGLRFVIEGHTDDQGGPKVNGPLSERRAAAVKAWLVTEGIAPARLTSKGLGQSRPVDTNASAEGRANNRRVEFVKS